MASVAIRMKFRRNNSTSRHDALCLYILVIPSYHQSYLVHVAEEVVLDVLRKVVRALVAVLVGDEVCDEDKEDVNDTFSYNGVHFDLLQSSLAVLLELFLVGKTKTSTAGLRGTTALQDGCSKQVQVT